MTKNELLNKKIKKYLSEYFFNLGIQFPEINLDEPGFVEQGDLSSNSSLKYSKIIGKSPMVIASDAVNYLKEKNINEIADIKFAFPRYINIFFNNRYSRNVLSDIIMLGGNYGSNNLFKGKKI